MPYTVVLALKSGRMTSGLDVFNATTPRRGDTIELEYLDRALKACVTAIGRTPAHTPGCQAFDIVTAQEIQAPMTEQRLLSMADVAKDRLAW